MMKICIDRAYKSTANDDVMSVASVIFKPVPYKRFAREWKRMLKPWGATAFHATDFYSGYEEFRRDTPERKELFDQDSKRIPSLIGPHIRKALVVAFRPGEVMPLLSEAWKERMGDSLHVMAVQLALLSIGQWAKESGYCEGFACFAEGGDDDSSQAEEVVKNMMKDHISGPHIQVATFTTVYKKGVVRGLEAADFFAWHWNTQYYRERDGLSSPPRKDFAAFIGIAGDKAEEIFLTGTKLRNFLTLGEAHMRLPQDV
jgi:hypothetical protein